MRGITFIHKNELSEEVKSNLEKLDKQRQEKLNKLTNKEDLYYMLGRYGANYTVNNNPTEEELKRIQENIEKYKSSLNIKP